MGSKLFEFTLFEDLLYYNYSDGSDEPEIWVFSNWLVTHFRKLILQIFHTRFFNIKEEDVKVLFALRKNHWTTEWYQRQLLSSSHPVQTVSQRAKIWRNTRYCLCKVKSSNFKCHFIQLSRYNVQVHTIRILIIALFILSWWLSRWWRHSHSFSVLFSSGCTNWQFYSVNWVFLSIMIRLPYLNDEKAGRHLMMIYL